MEVELGSHIRKMHHLASAFSPYLVLPIATTTVGKRSLPNPLLTPPSHLALPHPISSHSFPIILFESPKPAVPCVEIPRQPYSLLASLHNKAWPCQCHRKEDHQGRALLTYWQPHCGTRLLIRKFVSNYIYSGYSTLYVLHLVRNI